MTCLVLDDPGASRTAAIRVQDPEAYVDVEVVIVHLQSSKCLRSHVPIALANDIHRIETSSQCMNIVSSFRSAFRIVALVAAPLLPS